MVTNSYFNQYTNTNQQNLLESLIIESIQIYGFNMIYLPRTNAALDPIFRESDVNIFDTAITVETYLKSTEGFGGDGKFMSVELGWEIRDQMVLTVAQKSFKTASGLVRPNEGDLVYLPLDNKVYEIKYVDHQAVFYQLGKLNTWDMTCELLEFNGQIFRTGVPAIDAIDTTYTLDGTDTQPDEAWNDQSKPIQTETPNDIDFSEEDPFALGGSL